jgi:hypothetical protein
MPEHEITEVTQTITQTISQTISQAVTQATDAHGLGKWVAQHPYLSKLIPALLAIALIAAVVYSQSTYKSKAILNNGELQCTERG